MSNIEDNNSKIQENGQNPKLCETCFEFFGDPEKLNMCSKCFNDKCKDNSTTNKPKQKEPHDNEKEGQQEFQQFKSTDNEKQKPIVKSTEINSNPSNSFASQISHQRCFKCYTTTGYLGFKCKCEFTFCKTHRLPEAHSCFVDYKTMGKEVLKKDNQKVVSSKMEMIN